MRAARFDVRTRDLRIEEIPVPDPGPGEVRITVGAAGVCLSDVHLIEGVLRPAFLAGDLVTLGHEVAGTVDVTGPGVTGWEPGTRVLLQAGEYDAAGRVLTRGIDYDGGWAEYAVARADTLVAIPDDLPFEQACIIPDAVSTPWAAVVDTGAARAAQAAGVWGVGGLGAHAVQLLRLVGAAPIVAVDPLPEARERALAFGADVALDPADPELRAAVRRATDGRGLDLALDMAGVPAVREQAAACLGERGRLVLAGLTDQPLTVRNSIRLSYLRQQILGHYGSEPEHVEQLVGLVRRHRLDLSRSISGVLPLEDAPEAVERLRRKEGHPIRLVLRP